MLLPIILKPCPPQTSLQIQGGCLQSASQHISEQMNLQKTASHTPQDSLGCSHAQLKSSPTSRRSLLQSKYTCQHRHSLPKRSSLLPATATHTKSLHGLGSFSTWGRHPRVPAPTAPPLSRQHYDLSLPFKSNTPKKNDSCTNRKNTIPRFPQTNTSCHLPGSCCLSSTSPSAGLTWPMPA